MYIYLYQNAYLLDFHTVESVRLFDVQNYRDLLIASIEFAKQKYDLGPVLYSIQSDRVKFLINSPNWFKFNLNFNTYTTMRLKQLLIRDKRLDFLDIFKHRYNNFGIWQPDRFPISIKNNIEFKREAKIFLGHQDMREEYTILQTGLEDRSP